MKKFLTFVLVLAMVLSVSSVAFAATVYEVGTLDALKTALNNAGDGDTIKLTADIEYADATADSVLKITKSIILDGDNHKLSGYGQRGSNNTTLAITGANVTLQNLTIVNNAAGGRAIETRGGIKKLTIDNCNISCTGPTKGTAGYPQTLTIGGNQGGATAEVEIKNSTISNSSHYPIVTYNKVDMDIENSKISGFCAVYFKGADNSDGSKGSVLTAKDSVFDCPNNINDTSSNDFGVFVLEDTNISISLTDCKVNAAANSTAKQSVVESKSSGTSFELSVGGESEVIGSILDEDAATATTANTANTTITGGTFTEDPSAYTGDTLVAKVDGKIVVGEDNIEEAANSQSNVTVEPISGTGDLDLDTSNGNQVKVTDSMADKVKVNGNALTPNASPQQIPNRPQTTTPSTGGYTGPDLWYIGGNTFGTSTTQSPTKVEIDGVAVPFTMNGSKIVVGCVDPNANWVTAKWGSTTNTVHFTPDVNVVCTEIGIPKTGDMPFWAAVAAFFGF